MSNTFTRILKRKRILCLLIVFSDVVGYQVFGGIKANPKFSQTVLVPVINSHTDLTNGTGYYLNAARSIRVFTVKQSSAASQTIAFTALVDKTYGDAPFALTASASSGLTVSYTSSNPLIASISGNELMIHAAGTVTLTASQPGDAVYGLAVPVERSLVIKKRPITVIAEPKSKTYGDIDPGLTYQVIGELVSGDVFGGELSRALGESVGTYVINQNTLSLSNNYALTYVSKNLTINKALLTVRANPAQRCYEDYNPDFTISYDGFKNNENVNSLTIQPKVSTIANEESPAGPYVLSVSGGEAANYAFVYESGLLTVHPLPIATITSNRGGSVSRGDSLFLTASGGTEYMWTTLGIPSGQTKAEFSDLRPLSTTTYVVIVKNANGCEATTSYTVQSKGDYRTVKAENFITPNGDGVNDTWVVKNIDAYPAHTLTIVDRAGRVVYKIRDYQNDWAGTLDASPLQEGTYYYIFQFDQPDIGVMKGFITIVR